MTANQQDQSDDYLVDDPVPSYEDWLEARASAFVQTPVFRVAHAALSFARYVYTRERLVVSALLAKGIIDGDEVATFFGDEAHDAAKKEGEKQLVRHMMRAASQGELLTPKGKQILPDDLLALLNDVMDMNNTGWNGQTLETIARLSDDQWSPSREYETEIEKINELNILKAIRRQQVEDQMQAKSKIRLRRQYELQLYLSRCRVFEKELPDAEAQKQMLDGEISIPESL